MTAQEMIDRRRSVRSYTDEPLTEQEKERITACLAALAPLADGIPLRCELLVRAEARCTLPMPWLPHDIAAIYTVPGTLPLANVGFLFGALDLHLQAEGLGTCWLGLGRPKARKEEDGLRFTMMMAIGHPRNAPLRTGAGDFRRHPPEAIADRPDERLEPARLAASAVNGQPWYFLHEGDTLHALCHTRRSRFLRDMNRIDVGIALSHLAVANPATFRFFLAAPAAIPDDYEYIGSFTL